MTFEFNSESAMETQTQLGLESGFLSDLVELFRIGRSKRTFKDIKTFNTLSIKDIHSAPKDLYDFLDTVGYVDARVLRLTKPNELGSSAPEFLDAIVKVLSITDKEFNRLYVAPLQQLVGTLVNNTSKLSNRSPIPLSKKFNVEKTDEYLDEIFTTYSKCLTKKGDTVSTFGDLYPNATAFLSFGQALKAHYPEVTKFNLGNVNREINDVYELMDELIVAINTDDGIKVSKAVAQQIEQLAVNMSKAADLYVTSAQHYRILTTMHNEHIARMSEYAKKNKK